MFGRKGFHYLIKRFCILVVVVVFAANMQILHPVFAKGDGAPSNSEQEPPVDEEFVLDEELQEFINFGTASGDEEEEHEPTENSTENPFASPHHPD